MQVNPPRFVQNDGLAYDDWRDPHIPRDTTYWPRGLPRGLAGCIELLRCDARCYDWWESRRRAMVGEPPMTESTFIAKRLWALADLLERDALGLQRGRIPQQRRPS